MITNNKGKKVEQLVQVLLSPLSKKKNGQDLHI